MNDLTKLQECNIEKPYVFVSYSWDDADIVYRDVLFLQTLGYNIWIDKIKMDARRDTWGEQALKAIHDIDCKLILFYMSKNSLSSPNCYKEILAAGDDISKSRHGETFRVLLVQTSVIRGSFSDYFSDLLKTVSGNYCDMSKPDREKHCEAITGFKKLFCDGTEKTRWENKIRLEPMGSKGIEDETDNYYQQFYQYLPVTMAENAPNTAYSYSRERMIEKIRKCPANVCLTNKARTESNEFPFYERVFGVKHLTLLNFAGTAFIAGIDVANCYSSSEILRKWFEEKITDGQITATIILTNPRSFAAKDAEQYKMYPDSRKCEKEEIIRTNLNMLIDFCKKYPKADLQVYVTDIALPYGIMLAENFEEPAHNYMKVDLYAPAIFSDLKRPSFYLLNRMDETREMYDFFVDNLNGIRENHSSLVSGLINIDWLKEKPIAHRGRYTDKAKEHTRSAYRTCILNGSPLEVDLLEMRDGELVVCRDMMIKSEYSTQMLSRYTTKELYEMLSGEEIVGEEAILLNEMMSLDEFLHYVDGRVGILVELKDYAEKSDDPYHQRLAREVVKIIDNYDGNIAIHSANPYVLREIRKINRLIPIGQISLDYQNVSVSDDYKQLHLQTKYLDIVEPDFINYELQTLVKNEDLRKTVKELCQNRNIPLLVWNVCNKKDKRIAQSICNCNNYIAEGSEAFGM